MNVKPEEVGVESSVSERAGKASGEGDDSTPKLPDPEVPSRPRRRRYNAAYKRRVLEETDQLREPGQIGAYLRREGLHSSTVCRWRTQRDMLFQKDHLLRHVPAHSGEGLVARLHGP